jgi:hypothetical protein
MTFISSEQMTYSSTWKPFQNMLIITHHVGQCILKWFQCCKIMMDLTVAVRFIIQKESERLCHTPWTWMKNIKYKNQYYPIELMLLTQYSLHQFLPWWWQAGEIISSLYHNYAAVLNLYTLIKAWVQYFFKYVSLVIHYM